MAAPSKYNPDFHIPWVRGLARRGCTVEEICDELGIVKDTFYRWCKKDVALSDALKEGRSVTDRKVEDSLLKRALGYTTTERRTIVATKESGETYPAKVEVVEREIAPDTAACIFWLKNRDPDAWRDKREVDLSENITDLKNVMVAIRKAAENG